MKYREESGEIITGNSWVMRDSWDTRVKISKGLVTIPKQLTSIGVKINGTSDLGSRLKRKTRCREEEASIFHQPLTAKMLQNSMLSSWNETNQH
jgi:hypothetical protein